MPLLLPFVLFLGACRPQAPQQVDNPQLGVAATFPGPARLVSYPEASPFGFMEWHSLAYQDPVRVDESFAVNVAPIPPGRSGGTTVTAVLDTFRDKVLAFRYGKLDLEPLPAHPGHGFRYRAPGAMGTVVLGAVVVKGDRIFHAQAVVKPKGEAKAQAFLDSFRVTY